MRRDCSSVVLEWNGVICIIISEFRTIIVHNCWKQRSKRLSECRLARHRVACHSVHFLQRGLKSHYYCYSYSILRSGILSRRSLLFFFIIIEFELFVILSRERIESRRFGEKIELLVCLLVCFLRRLGY